MIGQRELVAGRTPQPDDVPDIGPFDLFSRYEHGAQDLPALRVQARTAVGLEDRALRTHPGRMAAATGEGPCAGHPIAALDGHRFGLGPRSPGQHGARIAEDSMGDRRLQVGRRGGAAAGLTQAPGSAGVGSGDDLDDVKERDRIGLESALRARQHQAEQLCLVQRIQQSRRQPAFAFDVGSQRGNARHERACALYDLGLDVRRGDDASAQALPPASR